MCFSTNSIVAEMMKNGAMYFIVNYFFRGLRQVLNTVSAGMVDATQDTESRHLMRGLVIAPFAQAG